MDGPWVKVLLVLVIFLHRVSAHSQSDNQTMSDASTTQTVTTTTDAPTTTSTTESTSTTSERTEIKETVKWVPLPFSPIWLEESSRAREPEDKINGEDDVAEAVVVENEYNKNNEEDEEIHPAEFASEERALPLDYDQLEDEEDEEEDPEDDEVTIQESLASEEKLTADPHTETKDLPPDQVDVEVKEWNEPIIQPLASNHDNAIDIANSVSAPWYDVMAVGLPPSVAYNWQFLMDLSAKLRTAPRSKVIGISTKDDSLDSGEYNTRLKYLLTRVQDIQATQSSPVKLDNLKQQHLLKSKLIGYNHNGDDDILTWAWRRAVPLQ